MLRCEDCWDWIEADEEHRRLHALMCIADRSRSHPLSCIVKHSRLGHVLADFTRPSGTYKTELASNRYRLHRKAVFTTQCLASLARRHFQDPKKVKWVPDGRWIIETRANGTKLVFTDFVCSFD